jgi:hypothetical protein
MLPFGFALDTSKCPNDLDVVCRMSSLTGSHKMNNLPMNHRFVEEKIHTQMGYSHEIINLTHFAKIKNCSLPMSPSRDIHPSGPANTLYPGTSEWHPHPTAVATKKPQDSKLLG